MFNYKKNTESLVILPISGIDREGGDIVLFITLVPKAKFYIKVFLFIGLTTLVSY